MSQKSRRLAPWQYATLYNPFEHFAMFGGVATGKSFTGSHFVIEMAERHPDKTGFIGANTYDQLTQATLRELFYWLDQYEIPWVIDKQPPAEWGARRAFKSYNNILSLRIGLKVFHIFTRVLSDPDALRGVEFSWYWLDETRDTGQDTHDVILSRMREETETPTIRRGLITTTTNGEDWTHSRFVKGNDASRIYGAMHVPTRLSRDYGIINDGYYKLLLRSYSELLAQQELDALHVNVLGGRAYYSASSLNARRVAPWGDVVPNRDRPLVIGADFNFSPAPCVWMVGQVGPGFIGSRGQEWWNHIHWFGEVSGVGVSSREMAQRVLSRYPDFFYEFYGDMSGNIGTTSNAGETDFNQIAEEFDNAAAMFSMSIEQLDAKDVKRNPRVKERVENMNAMFKNGLGEIRQTYNPDACPLFDGDVKNVGWKPTQLAGRGRLDDGGDKDRTHASDGAGYAVHKKFPPGRKALIVGGGASQIRSEINHAV